MGGKGRYRSECWTQSSSGGTAMETQRMSRRMMVSAQGTDPLEKGSLVLQLVNTPHPGSLLTNAMTR